MADMKALSRLAKEYGIYLIEDCAHCVEGKRDEVRPGQLSDAAVFSFYATKNMTCAEGGAIVTNNQSLLERIRPLRLHGVDTYAMDQRKDGIYRHWDMTALGYKCNMHDLSAALLLPQLARIEKTRKSRETCDCPFFKIILVFQCENTKFFLIFMIFLFSSSAPLAS